MLSSPRSSKVKAGQANLVHVLPSVVQHGLAWEAGDTKLLCTLLQVSASSRQAVLSTCIKADVRMWCCQWDTMQRSYRSLADWLSRHPRLPSSLAIHNNYRGSQVPTNEEQQITDAVQQCLAAGQPVQLSRLFWQGLQTAAGLGSFSSLQSLTSLTLTKINRELLVPDIPPSYLAHLTSLQDLTLKCHMPNTWLEKDSTRSCLQWSGALQQLTYLTSLTCENICLRPNCLEMLPDSLQELNVAAAVSVGDRDVQLQHLTALRALQLVWSAPREKARGRATLPVSITRLELSGSGKARLPTELKDLTLDILSLSTGVLGQLAKHPESRPDLLRLKLSGCVKTGSVGSLSVEGDTYKSFILDHAVSDVAMAVTCEGLAACTQLTWLGLEHCALSTHAAKQQFAAACWHLQNLREVESIGHSPSRHDVLTQAQRGAAMHHAAAAALSQ